MSRLRSKKAKAWKPPKSSSFADLCRDEELHVSTACEVGPQQEKEPPRADPKRIAWLKKTVTWCQVCQACEELEVSHHPERGHGAKGLKAPDSRTIRLCSECHRQGWHQRGCFFGRTPEQSRALIEDLIRENNLTYAGTL